MIARPAALLLSAAFVICPGAAEAQSAGRVIDRYIDAIGGRKAVERIDSTELSGTVSSADGRLGVFTRRTKRPHLYVVSLSWDDVDWSEGFNGRAAWQRSTSDEVRTLYGEAASRVRAEAGYASHRFIAPDKVYQAAVVGPAEVRGRQTIAIRAITTDGTTRMLFFDTGSHLLVKDSQETGDGLDERFYDDYRRAGEVLEPHRIEWRRGGETFRITVDRVAHNPPTDEQSFDGPSLSVEAPLDTDAVLSAASRNELAADPVRDSYMYTVTSASVMLDEQGNATGDRSRSYELFHLDGRRVARLLEENGRPLNEAEQRREEERVSAIVREYQRQRESGQTGRPRPVSRDMSSATVWVPLLAAGWLPALLEMSDFSHTRRERVGDRVAIVVEFQPRRGARADNDYERQAGTMAGTMWIDDASRHVTRVESYFIDDFGRTIQGSSLQAERTLLDDGVWVPSRGEFRSRMSSLFGLRPHFLATQQFADHRKFVVEARVEAVLPD